VNAEAVKIATAVGDDGFFAIVFSIKNIQVSCLNADIPQKW
jgi:hypothetical protein